MIKSNYRLTAVIDGEGEVIMSFSEDKEDSHRKMYQRISNTDKGRDFNVPVYGRFYSMIYGNSRRPQLIVYGESSDYRLEELSHYQDKYEDYIRRTAYDKKWDLLFLP